MSDFEFVIQDNVEIPKREFSGERVQRESQYPIAKMSKGQSFALPITGREGRTAKDKDGNEIVLTPAEDAKKQAAQKQSYFSSLGKRHGIAVVTRFFPNGEGDDGQPTLRVWHNGPRAQQADQAADEQEDQAADEQEDQADQEAEEEGLDL